MWNLWWTKWHWGNFLLVLLFPLSISIPPTAPHSYIREVECLTSLQGTKRKRSPSKSNIKNAWSYSLPPHLHSRSWRRAYLCTGASYRVWIIYGVQSSGSLLSRVKSTRAWTWSLATIQYVVPEDSEHLRRLHTCRQLCWAQDVCYVQLCSVVKHHPLLCS
jgi:hypothetical protein